MTAEHDRSAEVLRLGERALVLAECERSTFLDQECGDDADLRAAVEALLRKSIPSDFLQSPAAPEPREPALSPGTRLGPYEVVGMLGAGGMGAVYRARDRRLGRTVAIKVLGSDAALNLAARDRLLREARVVGSLAHPHICALYDIGSESGGRGRTLDYLVMEYLEGETLEDRLHPGHDRTSGSALPLEEALSYGIQITDALMVAHQAGIIHRDLKPSNIMLAARGGGADQKPQAKLLDFGLAKQLRWPEAVAASATTASVVAATAPGTVLGTIGYQSPEQARGEEVDARADLFAFGAVLYEMLTGHAAFRRQSPAESLAAVLDQEPPPPSRVNPLVPESFDPVVQKAVEKAPEFRYQSAADIKADLLRIRRDLTGRSSSASAGSGVRTTAAPVKAKFGRRLLTAALVLVAVGAAGAATWWWLGGTSRLPTLVSREISRGTGLDIDPAISPDGITVAYATEDEGGSDIWLTDLQGGPAQRWTTNPGADGHPSWSPDGRTIYFESDRNGRPGVYEAPRFNSEAATLVVPGATEPAVSPDGSQLAFTVGNPGESKWIAVARLDTPGRTRVVSKTGSGLYEHHHPTWSPNGRLICYSAADGLWAVPADGGTARQITHGAADSHPAWSASGYVYFSSRRSGMWQIWRVSATGGDAQPVTAGLSTERQPMLSRDGRYLAFSASASTAQVVVRDVASRVERPVPGGGEHDSATFSADGRLLYLSLRTAGRSGIWVQPLAGHWPDGATHPVELRFPGTPPRSLSMPAVSPDGNWLALMAVTGDSRHVWVTPAVGGIATNVTAPFPRGTQPAWSPDGRWLAFSAERDGPTQVWLQAMRSGQPVDTARRLTGGSAEEQAPAFSPDGRQVAFITATSRGDREVAVVDVSPPAKPILVTSGSGALRVRWTTKRQLLVSGEWPAVRPGHYSLLAVDPLQKATVKAFAPIDLGTDALSAMFDVTSDGGHLALLHGRTNGKIGVLEATSGRF